MPIINKTTYDMGIAMRQARIMAHLPRGMLTKILRISDQQLYMYETGQDQMPIPMMQALFAQAYNMMMARHVQHRYTLYCNRIKRLQSVGLDQDINWPDLLQPDDIASVALATDKENNLTA